MLTDTAFNARESALIQGEGVVCKCLPGNKGLIVRGGDRRYFYCPPHLAAAGTLPLGTSVHFTVREGQRIQGYRPRIIALSILADTALKDSAEQGAMKLRSRRMPLSTERFTPCPHCGSTRRPLPFYRHGKPVGLRCIACGKVLKRYVDVKTLKTLCVVTLMLDALILSSYLFAS